MLEISLFADATDHILRWNSEKILLTTNGLCYQNYETQGDLVINCYKHQLETPAHLFTQPEVGKEEANFWRVVFYK